MKRQRTYSWSDPLALAQLGTRMEGLEFATKLRNGDLPPPPAAVTAGVAFVDVGDGWSSFELEPQEWQYNPLGSVHGGILSTLADTALGVAVSTQLPRGSGFTSLDLVMKFTRSATLDSGPLTCEARVVSSGRRVATAEATITDRRGRLIAHAVSTCLIIAAPGPAGAATAGRLREWSHSSRIGSTPSTS